MITTLLLIFHFAICVVLAIWYGYKEKHVFISYLLAIFLWPFWMLGACVVLLLAILNAKWGSYDL